MGFKPNIDEYSECIIKHMYACDVRKFDTHAWLFNQSN